MGGSKRKPSLDFFPRIVDVLKWHLPTLRKIERNLFSSPPSSFLARSDICNWKYFLSAAGENLCQTFWGQSRDQTKKSQQKIPGQEILQFSFNVNFQAKNLSSALGSKVWWDYKEWNHLIPNSVWYGFYFSVCSVFSREREWKNNLNCSITQKRIVPSWFSISIRIDANRLLLLLSVRPFRGKWDLNLNCKVRREKRWKSAIPFCIATATVFSNNDHVLFQHNHHFLGKFGPI